VTNTLAKQKNSEITAVKVSYYSPLVSFSDVGLKSKIIFNNKLKFFDFILEINPLDRNEEKRLTLLYGY
jgi:hypothetical protein